MLSEGQIENIDFRPKHRFCEACGLEVKGGLVIKGLYLHRKCFNGWRKTQTTKELAMTIDVLSKMRKAEHEQRLIELKKELRGNVRLS